MASNWFEVRQSGLGWTPASAAGWAVVFGCVAVILCIALVFVLLLRSGANPGGAVAFLLGSTALVATGSIVIAMLTARR